MKTNWGKRMNGTMKTNWGKRMNGTMKTNWEEKMKKISKLILMSVFLLMQLCLTQNVFAWSARYDETTANTEDFANDNYDFQKVHNWIAHKAIRYLIDLYDKEGRTDKLWDDDKYKQYEKYIHYGIAFADEPWLGRPEYPNGHVYGVLENNGIFQLDAEFDSGQESAFLEKHGWDIGGWPTKAEAWSGWVIPDMPFHLDYTKSIVIPRRNAFMGTVFTLNPLLQPLEFSLEFNMGFGRRSVEDEAFENLAGLVQVIAADNIFHFAYDAMGGTNHVILHPEKNKDINNMTILQNSSANAVNYGAILYQLARKFMEGSWAPPSLDQLPYLNASNCQGCDKPGRVVIGQNAKIYTSKNYEISVDLPSTYLGGMPFTCANSSKTDTCRYGDPTWPIWVPENYEPTELEDFHAELKETDPGRSDRVGLTYLGWAAHMIQDLAMPHHAKNWHGYEHNDIENYANSLTDKSSVRVCDEDGVYRDYSDVDVGQCSSSKVEFGFFPAKLVDINDYMKIGLDELFPTRKEREDICRGYNIKISDRDLRKDTVNYKKVEHLFIDTAGEASKYANTWNNLKNLGDGRKNDGYLPRVREAIHATMKLFACVAPIEPKPAFFGRAAEMATNARIADLGSPDGSSYVRLDNPYHYISKKVYLPEPGDYKFNGSIYASKGCCDSAWVTFGGKTKFWGMTKWGSWRRHDNGPTFYIDAPGEYTMKIRHRENISISTILIEKLSTDKPSLAEDGEEFIRAADMETNVPKLSLDTSYDFSYVRLDSPGHYISKKVYFPAAGEYKFNGSIYASKGYGDSAWVTVGGKKKFWGLTKWGSWKWHDNGPTFYIDAPGEYTVKISRRENINIDSILIKKL